MNKYFQPVDDEIDLHLLTKEEAREAVLDFLQNAIMHKYTKVRIITGKGIHSKNGVGVLNVYIRELLDQMGYSYQTARYDEGCEGAIDVLLFE